MAGPRGLSAGRCCAAAVARLRGLELALEIQSNELAAIRIWESDTASQLVLANARSWAIHGGDDSSGGNGSYATVPSTSSTASQHGLLASLTAGATQFVLGRKGAISDAATSAPAVTGYDGSQASMPSRSLFPINLYDLDPTDGASSTQVGSPPVVTFTTTQTVVAPTKTAQGQDRSPPIAPHTGASSSHDGNPRPQPEGGWKR